TTNPDLTGAFVGNNNLIGALGTSTGLTVAQQLTAPVTIANVLAPVGSAGLNGATAPAPFTLALVDNSPVTTSTNPAIGGGDNTAATGTTDQRGAGFPRKIDNTLVSKPNVDIGAYEYGPVVQGQKFNDSNGNVAKDGTEATLTTPVQNFVVYVDDNNNSTLDSAEKRVTVATGGNYTLLDTKSNSPVREQAVTNWQQTFPTATATPYNTGIADSNSKDFGNFQSMTINGLIFDDKNG
ncbi:choice-of-anchor Q domain-containing protein, partial [Microcoleus anatoxicus]